MPLILQSFLLTLEQGNAFSIRHYQNLPMQYTEIVFENFHDIIVDIFLIFPQNIDCGYTLERRF